MVRPVRVPQTQVGMGAPAYLPSAAAQAAPAQALAGAVGQVAGVLGSLAQQKQRKQDRLDYTQQQSQARAMFSSGATAIQNQLDDYVRSPEFTTEGYAALQDKLTDELYGRVSGVVTHPQLKGQYQGVYDAYKARTPEERQVDIDAAVAARSLYSLEDSYAELSQFAADGFGETAAEEFGKFADNLVADYPEFREQVDKYRQGIFAAIKTGYGSDWGQVAYQIDLSQGAFDALGADIVGPTKVIALEQAAFSASRLLQLTETTPMFGDAVPTMGPISTLQRTGIPDQLQSLLVSLEPAQDTPIGGALSATLRSSITQAQAQEQYLSVIDEWAMGRGQHVGVLTMTPEVETVFNTWWSQAAEQDLLRMEPDEAYRWLRGHLPQMDRLPDSVQRFVLGQLNNNNPNPLMASAVAKAVMGINDSNPGRIVGTGPDAMPTTVFDGSTVAMLSHLAKYGSTTDAVSASLALQTATGLGAGQAAFVGTAQLPASASKAMQEKVKDELRLVEKRFEAGAESMGLDKVEFDSLTVQQTRDILSAANVHYLAEAQRGTPLKDDAAMQQYAVDLAVHDFLNTHKPIRIGEKVHFNRELTDALGDNPPDAIEFELYTYFKEDGYSDRDATALLNRVMLYDYHPSTGFKVMLRPEDEDGVFTFYTRPGDELYGGTRFRFDAADNAWLRATQATQDILWLDGANQALRGEGGEGGEVAASRARQEFVDLAMMSPEQQIAGRNKAIAAWQNQEGFLTQFKLGLTQATRGGLRFDVGPSSDDLDRIGRNREYIAELQQLPGQRYVFMANPKYRNMYESALKAQRTYQPQTIGGFDPTERRMSGLAGLFAEEITSTRKEHEALQVVRKAIERDSQSWTAQQWVRFFNTGKTP